MSSEEATRFIPSSPPPSVNHSTRPRVPAASTSSTRIGSAFLNVYHLVHGAGESVRGRILGVVDDLENRGEQKHHRISRQGEDAMRTALAGIRRKARSSTAQHTPQQDSAAGHTTL
ncbi:hypothetical protein FB45DRAFT_1063498 [Roridomyces roridus]|uniref:Uncharacterized protein n=1 Tax=Roridomyces roridus TaxID=1738132 RepID=A0AAD7BDY6_9AGAR|nr:hypothetical protein FB45DRAFT_1063498 [Roridomyces roridus]